MFYFLAQQTNNAVQHVSHAVVQQVEDVVKAKTWLMQHGAEFLVDMLVASLLCLAGAYVIRMLVFSVRKAIQKSGRTNVLLETFICNAVKKICWVILIMLVLQKLGINMAPLLASVGVMGIVIGFACQDSLANLAAGMMIALNHPFKVGDFVSGGGAEGFVVELNMMATTLLTGDNKKVTVPNKVIWATPITNFFAMPCRRVEVAVNIAYGSDITKVKQVAQEVLRHNRMILTDPPPMVEVMTLGNASLCFVIRPWCKPTDYWDVLFYTTAAVNDAFVKNGIRIALPEQIIHTQRDITLVPARDGDRT